jgi:DNA-binding transcriptional MerR regulator
MGAVRLYRTSQFARKATVSVRTLRYYDRLGLLVPTQRSPAGYRLYSDQDFLRLQEILALKFLGFSLDEIQRCLAAGPRRLQAVLGQQKAMMREKRAQLDAIVLAIEQAERQVQANPTTWEPVVRVIEVIQMQQKDDWVDKYFTPEQRAAMDRLSQHAYSEEARQKLAARGPWTEEDQRRVSAQWAALFAERKRLTDAGADPAGPEGQALAKSWSDLVAAFTQHDPELVKGLRRWWQGYAELPAEERPLAAAVPSQSEEETRFIQEALAIYGQRQASEGEPS